MAATDGRQYDGNTIKVVYIPQQVYVKNFLPIQQSQQEAQNPNQGTELLQMQSVQ